MRPRTLQLFIAAIFLYLPLAGLAYLGSFTRFYADDFCMASDAMHLGLPGMLAKWYTFWTGRFSFLVGTGLLGLGGPKFAGWLAVIVLITWLGALTWAIFPLLTRAGLPQPGILAGLAGALILLLVLSTTPNLFQSFFWQDGMVNYTLPLVGLTINGGVILRGWLGKPPLILSMLAAFAIAFISGGFTEIVSAMQVCLFVLALAAALGWADWATRRRSAAVLAAALVGGLAAIAIVLVAPGNQVRLATNGATPGLLRIITFSMRNAAVIVAKYFLWTPGWAFISAAVPFLSGWVFGSTTGSGTRTRLNLRLLWARNWFRGAVLVLLTVVALVVAACAPVVFALNAYPDDRSIFVPQFVLAVGVVTASALLGYGFRSLAILPNKFEKPVTVRLVQVVILAALILAAGGSIWNTASQGPDYQAYARAWDKRAADLQQAGLAGLTEVTVRGLTSRFGVSDLEADPGFWINGCVAGYYGIEVVHGN